MSLGVAGQPGAPEQAVSIAPIVSRAIRICGIAVVAALCATVGWVAIYSTYQPYDDEGTLLLQFRSYLAGENLYEDIATPYGPFYYLALGALFRLPWLDVVPDDGRLITLIIWLLTSVGVALFLLRRTRSTAVALGGQMLAFWCLLPLVNEPPHPGALISLLLVAALLLAQALPRLGARAAGAGLGAVCAGLLLIKPNLGVFAFAAVLFAACVVLPPRGWRALPYASGAMLVALPLLLVQSRLFDEGIRRFLILEIVSALALVGVALKRRVAPQRELWREMVAGLAVGAAATIGAVFLAGALQGTSPADYLSGGVGYALRISDLAKSPIPLPLWVIVLSLGSLATAAWFVGADRQPRPETVASVRLLAGGAMWVLLAGGGVTSFAWLHPDEAWLRPGPPFAGCLALVWVMALPLAGEAQHARFVRLLLAALAAVNSLHVYPVAASQVGFASLLFAIVGGVLIADGVRGLAPRFAARTLRLPALRPAIPAVIGSILVCSVAWFTVRTIWIHAGAQYRGQPASSLPGMSRLHLSPLQTEPYSWLVAELPKRCDTFIGLPGLGILYLMTGQPAPATHVAGPWMNLLDDERQEAAVRRLHAAERVCLVHNRALVRFWGPALTRPAGASRPLVDYVRNVGRWHPVGERRGYELLVRRGQPEPGL